MLNLISADFYRLFRSKGFYIGQFLLIVVVAISILSETLGSIGVHTEETPINNGITDGYAWTGFNTIFAMSTMGDFLIYFCVPLLVIIVGYDITKKTNKNLLTAGVSRTQYYLSKYSVFLLVSFLQFIFFYLTSFLTASLSNGFGTISAARALDFVYIFILQYVSIQAIFAVGMLFLYLLDSNVVSAVFAVLLFPIIFAILTLVIKIDGMHYFDFQSHIGSAQFIINDRSLSLKYVLSALTLIVLLNSLSLLLFKRKEI